MTSQPTNSEPIIRERAIPRATYRLQLHAGFTFDDAARIAPYLARLGISHAYLSPILQAAPGSTHGYDAVDPTRIDRERGGAEGLRRLREALAREGLGLVVDIVPNHLAVGGPENRWWRGVLEHGPLARHSDAFDVEWSFGGDEHDNRVLLPVLGDHYGRCLEAGQIRVVRGEQDPARFEAAYFDHRYPLSPRTLDAIFRDASEIAAGEASADLAFLADASFALPDAMVPAPEAAERRARDAAAIRRALRRLLERDEGADRAIDAALEGINGDVDALDALLERQNYRLAFWRLAGSELNYRRFFDINTLIGVRAEDPRVFEQTHRLVLELARDRTPGLAPVDGLRIDHPDGLRDPAGYFARLAAGAPGAWIVAEKILEPGEPLREDWAVAGTTGYDFLNLVQGLFVDRSAEGLLTDVYRGFAGEEAAESYAGLVDERKLAVARELLGGDVARLVEILAAVCRPRRRQRDFTRAQLRRAVETLAAAMPVYRTYVPGDEPGGEPDALDERYVEEAVERARTLDETLDAELLEFLRDLLLLRVEPHDRTLPHPPERDFVMRFQQLTGPLMAKGVEDTAFYRYHRLIALNEVGGDPGRFGGDVEAFHAECAERTRRWPHAMLAGSTHDTKRSEDVRARIAVLSEIPREWAEAVRRWSGMNGDRRGGEGAGVDRNAEYLFYQTVVGAWPIEADRVAAFMIKAAKEAKARTSWVEPDEAYEGALERFVRESLADRGFTEDVERFVRRVAPAGRINALAQTLVRLTAPGVPDTYQGTELWDFSLVDPDNRRPVDYERRSALLGLLDRLSPAEVWTPERMEDGLAKLHVVRGALGLRAERPGALRGDAAYGALRFEGDRAAHAVGYVRGGEVAVVVPRLVAGLLDSRGGMADAFAGTVVELPGGRWADRLTGRKHEGGAVRLADLFAAAPAALLVLDGA